MKPITFAAAAALLAASLGSAAAEPIELQWWHAMTAINAERVNKIATDFNALQTDYKITPVYKGSYPETMTAAVAAFRAGNSPHIVRSEEHTSELQSHSDLVCRLLLEKKKKKPKTKT